MYVACSTLCFANQPLDDALRTIGELGFTKVDIAVKAGGHLLPTEVSADPSRAAQALKSWPGVTTTAFQLEFEPETSPADARQQLRAVCRLSRALAVSIVTIPAANNETEMDAEQVRLHQFVSLCEKEGVSLAVETRMGTLTETPAKTIELCKRVPGLGVALDPSHYVAGPYHSQEFDELYPYVKHVRLRDTGRDPEKFQVRVGQGEIEYGKIVNQLARCNYNRTLSVDMHDHPTLDYPMLPEVRKLKYLLESLI